MIPKSHYEVLGVARRAEAAAVRAAYRRLAKLHHPDVAKGPKDAAAARFRKIQDAYEVLSDAQRRAKYDAQLDAAEQQASQDRPFPWPPSESSRETPREPSRPFWGPSCTPEQRMAIYERRLMLESRAIEIWMALMIVLVLLNNLTTTYWPAFSVSTIVAIVAIPFIALAVTGALIEVLAPDPYSQFASPPEPEPKSRCKWKLAPRPPSRATLIARRVYKAIVFIYFGFVGLALGLVAVTEAIIRIKG